jgi:predicted GNAT family N-acyltransferase
MTAAAEPREPGVTVRRAERDELPAILALRHQVFCVEQGVPEDLERDERDRSALHLVALSGLRVVGTCRLTRGSGQGTWRLGRMAVAADWRGRGVGEALMARAHAEAGRAGARRIALAAQVAVRGFYERLGYEARGETFTEAGIEHIAMTRSLGAAA